MAAGSVTPAITAFNRPLASPIGQHSIVLGSAATNIMSRPVSMLHRRPFGWLGGKLPAAVEASAFLWASPYIVVDL